ncbi:uncharacterized protein B0T23DRAFT_407754 [Neurospora hispaniola]|uniref:Uncharacterized protein n=1 Tax=Neurospora hispaniola TaxID=588809 RepID=A0AAJ0I1C0_9PEZI|nr:hypothetical protein B0T23DRAFT_407754 [Neurospora hispaniola]
MWIPEVDEMETTGAVDSAVSSSRWITGVGVGRMADGQIFSLHLAPGLRWFFALFHHGHCTVHLLPIRTRLLGLECLDMPKSVALSVTYTQHNTSQHSTLIRDPATWKMWLCCGEHQKRKNPEMKDIGSLALEIRKWMRSLFNRRSKTRGAQTDLPERGKAC